MKKLHFEIHINAPVEKVWNTMLEDVTYRQWTDVFMPGSYYEGSWDEGSDIRFLGPDEYGKVGGMISKIASNKKYEYISVQHIGIIKNGVDDTQSEEVKKWAGAFENYTFKSEDNGTTLLIDTDSTEEEASYFEKTWPKALEKLKALAEK